MGETYTSFSFDTANSGSLMLTSMAVPTDNNVTFGGPMMADGERERRRDEGKEDRALLGVVQHPGGKASGEEGC